VDKAILYHVHFWNMELHLQKALSEVPGCILVSSTVHETFPYKAWHRRSHHPHGQGVHYFISFTVVKKFPGRIYDYMNLGKTGSSSLYLRLCLSKKEAGMLGQGAVGPWLIRRTNGMSWK
jgi:hypothetical protein